MIRNSHNWTALYRALWVFANPVQFAWSVLRRSAPASVRLRTPTGTVTLNLRNFESLKTAFSVFCREDYRTETDRSFVFLDVGANVGISAVYFLTRNGRNTVRCYEPDSANLEFLTANLDAFGARATVHAMAVGTTTGTVTLYCSEDGKYTSTLASHHAVVVQRVPCVAFGDVLAALRRCDWPVIVKLDVEGIERELIGYTDFAAHPHVTRLFCESTDCSSLIARRHIRSLRNGYVEDLRFLSGTTC
ncbi:MAG TPA: FkbM family methyltransferase [Steroidobacteraceae bacterium]|nr:FkbM family methyltransferase [Steroidobacteraceae bacterium]